MAYQNSCQTQRNNKEFTQISRQQQLLASIQRALKVTVPLITYSILTRKKQYAVQVKKINALFQPNVYVT